MILLQAQAICKSFAAEPILTNISVEVKLGEHVALVGRNGAGKSTLLKIIAGAISADSGTIIVPKEKTIGYLPQNATLNSSRGIYDELLTVFQPLLELERKLHAMEEQIAVQANLSETDNTQLLSTYDTLLTEFKTRGGYTYDAEIRGVLNGLQFGGFPDSTPVSNLSGGQKTQLALGKLLLIKPDLLILDEPTNHLDIETLSWLENYLQRYPGGILVVSHDRYFLDKVVTKVYEIARHQSKKYSGNYSRYIELQAAEREQEVKNYEKQQKEISRLNDFVQKNIVRASTTKRAQSRRKQLEKMTVLDRPQGDQKAAEFAFTVDRQSGRDVLSVKDMTVGYAGQAMIRNLHFQLTRGDRVALVGPNGIGKSTVLKAIAGGQTLISGDVQLGSHVTIGYYDQEQTSLNDTKTVLNELWDDYPLKPENELRNILGGFLFSGDEVLKRVSLLSGGEKARLLLAKLMMRHDNLLILDEPTNHLDLESKEVLENVLDDYPGTLLFVSHDRYFINHIANHIFELSRDGLVTYLGDYDYYIEKKNELAELARLESEEKPANENAPAASSGKQQFLIDKETKKVRRQLERTIERLEQAISTAEETIETKQQALVTPEVFNDVIKARDVQAAIEEEQATLAKLMEEWEDAQTSLEALGQ
ncbi:MAG: ATP-binding cassette domain-containing protein [Sporolactobacillus sp.]